MHLKSHDASSLQQDIGSDLPELVRQKAEGLFLSGEMLCAPAVLNVINQTLGGELSRDHCCRLTSGLAVGQGGAGCTCGALSGANLAVGLMLGGKHCGSRQAQKAARQLHDGFKLLHGSTCCRVLTKKVKHDKQKHMAQCAAFTGNAAKMALEIILTARPDLAGSIDVPSQAGRGNPLKKGIKRLLRVIN